MPSGLPPPKRKLPIVQLAVLGAVGLLAGVLILRGVDIRGLIEQLIATIRTAGPVAFFTAMAVLPALGVPLLAFTITAGEAFAAQLGMGGVIALSLLAIAINLALGYWFARYALRPLLARLIQRYGYSVPKVTRENALSVTLVVRLTPGPPYAFQACILGLAEVPFRLYVVTSWICILPWAVGGIVLGKGLLSGKFGVAAMGMGVLIVAVVLIQFVRKKFMSRRSPGESVQPAGTDARG